MPDHKRSRCTIPHSIPLRWHDFIDDDNEDITSFYIWLNGLNVTDQELVIGRIRALRELAADGEIAEWDDEALKPIHADPEMFELRWNELDTLIRQYHAEPESLPLHLINLHLHIKEISPTSDAVTGDLQQIQINWAALRFKGGAHRNWGV